MKKQLELLVQLQSCDSTIQTAQRIQENHPRMISQLEDTLAREREELRTQEKLLDDTKKKRIRKEQELALDEERVQKAKQKLTAVKTNREYQAALKEIELIEHENASIEEEILAIMEETDNLTRKRAELEEHMRARDTLQRLDQMKKGEELLVPIGANVFIYASVKNARKVIDSVGSGVAVEDTVKKAIERLDDSVKQLNEAGQKLAERVQEMDCKARELAAEVDKAYQQMAHKH